MNKTVKTDFDVIIVGGGPAGLFAAYYLAEHSDLDVLVIDKGKRSLKRNCPLSGDQECIKCRPCNILCGVGGAGLFSDGKLNFIHKLGKTDLTQFVGTSEAVSLIDETEEIFNRFGMDGKVFPTDMDKAGDIRKDARKHGIDLLVIKQKHLAVTICRGISPEWLTTSVTRAWRSILRKTSRISWSRTVSSPA